MSAGKPFRDRNPSALPEFDRLAAFGGAMNEERTDRRSTRAAQQSREIEENQEALRRSIAETERLVTESENMLRRHRRERDEDEDEAE